MKYLILFILWWMPHLSIAQNGQERETEWSLRTGTSVDYKLNKKWKMDLNWESRFNDNISAYEIRSDFVTSVILIRGNFLFGIFFGFTLFFRTVF